MESKIKSFEAACQAEKIDMQIVGKDLAILEQLSEPARSRAIANYQLDIIIPAKNNEGQDNPWIPDYENYSRYKYKPYFRPSSSGSGWASFDYVRWLTYSYAGARREFRSYDVMIDTVKTFPELYNAVL
ncbi:hypothetical protein [Flavobacterium sp.]|uniref:hypothetical protein n=1 Tax=Flavobacterium sp. TaxID=239 RepID=UPI002607CEC5|nr:hypothetical protein [Flavobacterium sp.]